MLENQKIKKRVKVHLVARVHLPHPGRNTPVDHTEDKTSQYVDIIKNNKETMIIKEKETKTNDNDNKKDSLNQLNLKRIEIIIIRMEIVIKYLSNIIIINKLNNKLKNTKNYISLVFTIQ